MIALSLITPEETFLKEEVHQVVIPASCGVMGVLKGHVPMITPVVPGVVQTLDSNNKCLSKTFVGDGFAEIDGNHCIILISEAIDVNDIDKQKVNSYIEELKSKITAERDALLKAKLETDFMVASAKKQLISF